MNHTAKLPATRWRLQEGDRDREALLTRELGLHPIVSRVLLSREMADPDGVRRYLSPSLKDLHNPFLLQDMRKAVERVITALHRTESIVVYGDYDADGITSVVLLIRFLRQAGAHVDYYIPDRISEGYGLNRPAIDGMRSRGVSLIVTVDCGISDHEEITYARQLGMDTVVLDHHEISRPLPDAVAAVNPHREDCRFPFKHLAAVGIVFNFLIALRGALREDGFWARVPYPNLKDYLDLVALGTIGDIVPLVDENRVFVKMGLELMTQEQRLGIQALKSVSGIERQGVDTGKASYCLIPRINASGRLASARDAVELLLTDDPSASVEIARELDGYNRKRQALEKAIFAELLAQLDGADLDGQKGPLVFASPSWHPGVIGIVASRVVERFGRPAILISLKDGIGKGSGRSVADFNIYQGLKRCESLLLSYGGHRYAAGICIREEDIGAFSALLREIVREEGQDGPFVAVTAIDAQCSLNDIDHELLRQFERMAPFGSHNPEPLLCCRRVSAVSPTVVGNNHLRMRVCAEGVSRNSIWFGSGHYLKELTAAVLDIVFTPQLNHWNGTADIQLKMKDIAIQAAS